MHLLRVLQMIVASEPFLNWLTPKYQKDWADRGQPLLNKGLEEGALSTKDYNTIASILSKSSDGIRNKLRAILKKAGLWGYNDREEFFKAKGLKPDADGTMGKDAWKVWDDYINSEGLAFDRLQSLYGSPYVEKQRTEQIKQLNEWKGSAKNKQVLEAIDLALKYYTDFQGISQSLTKIEVLEANKMKYRPKPAKSGSLKEVQNLLLKAMEEVKEEQVKQWTKILTGWAEYFVEKKKAEPKLRLSKFYQGQKASMTARLLEGDYTKLRADAEKIAEEQAREIVKAMQNQFVGKNMGKLTPIIEGRGGFKDAEMGGGRTSAGAFEGSIHIEFDDGAHFTAITKLVWGMNQHGTSYMQYPTTFHDVEAPGLEAKKSAPEQWMNETFAKKA